MTAARSRFVAHRSLRRQIKCRGQNLHHTWCDDQRVFNFYCLYLEPVMLVELHVLTCGVVSMITSVTDKQPTLMPVLMVDEAEESLLTAVWCFTNKSGIVQIHNAKSKRRKRFNHWNHDFPSNSAIPANWWRLHSHLPLPEPIDFSAN